MNTMATPGQPSVCFSCGHPIPVELTMPRPAGPPAQAPYGAPAPDRARAPYGAPGGAGPVATAAAMPAAMAMEGGGGGVAPGFRGQPPPPNLPSGASLRGAPGQFMIRAGTEVRVGRDPGQCSIFLTEPRVSGVHATLRFEAGQLLVRDETSNNGTWVSGARIAPGTWTPVPSGPLRFGPVEFNVQLEG
jgi:hypothetical protein